MKNDTHTMDAAATGVSSSYRNYVLAMLMLVYMSNYLDRSIMAVISPAIKEDLDLSDTQLGLLKGLAFAFFYACLSVPVAWLADRWNRVSIIAICVAIWSAFTALAALTANFLQLALTRIGVGVGEAGGVAPAHSIIAGYYRQEERARALAVYSLAIPIGDALALLLGGWVLQNFGWRSVFLVIGVPGLILALILKLTVREPARGAVSAKGGLGFGEAVKTLLRIPGYPGLLIAVAFATFSTNGAWFWIVDFFVRSFELTYTEITTPLAFVSVSFNGLGTYLGGYLCDKISRRTHWAFAIVPGGALLFCIPFLLAFIWAPTPFLSFAALAFVSIAFGAFLAPSFALAQALAPVQARAMATSIVFLSIILLGVGLGPVWVGALSDALSAMYDEAIGLNLAMSTLVVSLALGAVAYWRTGARLSESLTAPTGV